MKNKQYNRLFDWSLKLVIATIFSFSLINSPILFKLTDISEFGSVAFAKSKEEKAADKAAKAESKAAKKASKAADKAAKEASKAADKAAKEASKAADKATKEATKAAEKSAKEATKAVEKSAIADEKIKSLQLKPIKSLIKLLRNMQRV